ncbi:MAG: SUMF1/EgtB/PvdO family nonheme iron enzyme, partial [Planctomycetes bacterium]|nr:SUMF1/EgtB/PvdO family nonheme iron enzyme [Planctomycetota bacterium]
VEAEDLAGNQAAHPAEAIEGTIDRSVGLELPQGARAWIALGRAFVEVREAEGEELSSLEARDAATGEAVGAEVFPAPGEVRSAGDLLDVPSRKPVAPDALRSGQLHLLSAWLPDPARPFSLALAARDAAFPPNERTWTIEVRPPAPLAREDLVEVSIAPGGADPPHVVPAAELGAEPEGKPEAELEARRPRGLRLAEALLLRQPRLRDLSVKTAPGRVLHATLELGDEVRRARASSDGVRFEGVDFAPDRDVEAVLDLRGALEDSLELRLVLHGDTRPPRLSAVAPGPRERPYFAGAAEARIDLEASEPLAEVTASRGARRISGAAVPGAGRSLYRIAGLGALGIEGDGEHEVLVEARDRAGHAAEPLRHKVVVDSGPPRIAPVGERDPDGRLRLEGSKLLLSVVDPNGVDPQDASCRIEYEAEAGGRGEATVPLTHQEGDVFSASLRGLPGRCSGSITALVKDALGLATGSRPEDRIPFVLVRPAPAWRRAVRWRGVDWILADPPRRLYLSRTEVSNRLFRNGAVIRGGSYVLPDLARFGRPRYWTEAGEPPRYLRQDGTIVPGDDFPVAGVSPEEAEAFARAVFGARLPAWSELVASATAENPGGRYPWKDEDAGRAWCNHRDVQPGSPVAARRALGMASREGKLLNRAAHIEADFDPYPREAVEGGAGFARLLHLAGNVAEIVRLDAGGHGLAGGHYDASYAELGLDREPPPYGSDAIDRWSKTGFRLAMTIEGAPAEFIAAAREGEEP